MADLRTTYMGLELRNPVIAGASRLTANLDKIRQLEQAGAGAIVCASLFEEQIQLERVKFDREQEKYTTIHPEMLTVFPQVEHAGPQEHLMWVRRTVESVKIPVIASLNAVSRETWIEYAVLLAGTGAAGLELNFYYTPDSADRPGAEIEADQIAILKEIKAKVSIPVSAKLSCFYSNPLHVISAMDRAGVDALVLFNRFFEPDIDVDKEAHARPLNLSKPGDNRLTLRFLGTLYGQVRAGLCGSTGVFTGADVVKAILAGADCVQVVSALCRNGVEHVKAMVDEVAWWMDKKGYKSLKDFRGKLARKNLKDPFVYHRAQYVSLILQSEKIVEG